MADVYKQSFKQNYTNNIELSIFNCGIERCIPPAHKAVRSYLPVQDEPDFY